MTELRDLIFLAAASVYAGILPGDGTSEERRKMAIDAAQALWEDVCERPM